MGTSARMFAAARGRHGVAEQKLGPSAGRNYKRVIEWTSGELICASDAKAVGSR